MRALIITVLVLLFSVNSVPAKEEYEPIILPQDLLEKCLSFVEDDYEKHNESDEQFCNGFFQGFAKGMSVQERHEVDGTCIPSSFNKDNEQFCSGFPLGFGLGMSVQERAEFDGICIPSSVGPDDFAKIYTEFTKRHLDYLAAQEMTPGYSGLITKSLQEMYPCNKEEGIKSLLAKAEKGDSEAQYKVGSKYSLGIDVLNDDKKAFEWYEKAAKQGHPMAQHDLGAMYFDGSEEGIDKAIFWLNKAMEHETTTTIALITLSSHYFTGLGVPKDVDKAIEYYTKAAELGDEVATFRLGEMYYEGTYVPQNYAKAVYWLTKAAKQGTEMAQDYLQEIENKRK